MYKGQEWDLPPRTRPQGRQPATLKAMLSLHANAGITFDLSAIRASATGRVASRFQSMVSNCQWNQDALIPNAADVWVFVDGEQRFSRKAFRRKDGPIKLDIPLEPNAQFLTLVSTDGGDGISWDNICFLEPRILLETVLPEGGALKDRMK